MIRFDDIQIKDGSIHVLVYYSTEKADSIEIIVSLNDFKEWYEGRGYHDLFAEKDGGWLLNWQQDGEAVGDITYFLYDRVFFPKKLLEDFRNMHCPGVSSLKVLEFFENH